MNNKIYNAIKNNKNALKAYYDLKNLYFYSDKSQFISFRNANDNVKLALILYSLFDIDNEYREIQAEYLKENKLLSNLKFENNMLNFTYKNKEYEVSALSNDLNFIEEKIDIELTLMKRLFPKNECYNNSKTFLQLIKNKENFKIVMGLFSPTCGAKAYWHFMIEGVTQEEKHVVLDPTYNLKMDKELYYNLYNFKPLNKFSFEEINKKEEDFKNTVKKYYDKKGIDFEEKLYNNFQLEYYLAFNELRETNKDGKFKITKTIKVK